MNDQQRQFIFDYCEKKYHRRPARYELNGEERWYICGSNGFKIAEFYIHINSVIVETY